MSKSNSWSSTLCSVLGLTTLLIACFTLPNAALKEGDCEVCIKCLTRFHESLPSEKKSDPGKIEKAFKKFCKEAKGKEDRLCYYLGGSVTSATGMLGEMSKPLSFGKPVEKICEALKKKDAQICELKYDKTIDFKTVKLSKLRVKELKKILADWGEDNACKGCAEKSDFISKIKELLPKYEPEAAKARKDEL